LCEVAEEFGDEETNEPAKRGGASQAVTLSI